MGRVSEPGPDERPTPPGPPPQPTLTDGVVTLRRWRDEDIDEAIAGHDEEIAYWFGFPVVTPSYEIHKQAVDNWHTWYDEDRRRVNFLVEADGAIVGNVEVQDRGNKLGSLSWTLYAGRRGRGYATRAVRLLADYAFAELGLSHASRRRSTRATPSSLRVASRAGLRREGVRRMAPGMADVPDGTGVVVLGRLATDPPVTEPEGFRSILNSALPRKRAISQLLVRDTAGRVLLCQLTYKRDWDLPGGVVEVGESPRAGERARDRGGAGPRRSSPAGCCSPTGCRPGAAGTTPSASSSTAASTTPRSSTRWSRSHGRSRRPSSAA